MIKTIYTDAINICNKKETVLPKDFYSKYI